MLQIVFEIIYSSCVSQIAPDAPAGVASILQFEIRDCAAGLPPRVIEKAIKEMKMKALTIAAATLTAAVGITSGVAHAEPAAAPIVHWTAKVVDKTIVVQTDSGSLTTRDGVFQVLDNNGAVVDGLPLSYFMDGKQFPIASRIDGNTATLTPSTDSATARPAEMPIKQVDAQADATVDQALGNAGGKFGLGVGVGTLVGGIIGLVGGCILGALTVGILTAPVFFAGALGGCISGAAIGAGLLAVIGGAVVGVPVGIGAALQFFQTIFAPAPAPAAPAAAPVN
ncbi:hypothetical protein ACQPZ2_29230 [Nocardia pseudovaccinii]|uniref:hypothetical protein n=1 Tax=Nocardia pseudovaccinii TaxID=189540 RepID=UPI003D8A0667